MNLYKNEMREKLYQSKVSLHLTKKVSLFVVHTYCLNAVEN
jgi:hypothetical protein